MDQKISIPTPIFTSVFSYDGIQRPWESSASRQGSSQPFWDQIRSYDNVGNVLGLTTTVPTSSGSTQTEQEAFCYDALNRVVWAGNTGTPSGGDHCMWSAPGSTSLPAYTQHFSYDDLDRLTTGPAGTLSYLDAAHLHAATHLSSIPNRYAAYDSMGNMTCRNIDPTSGHTCGTTPTGAQMTYDTEGRLANWTAPSGTTSSISYLYDNAGNRVLQHQSTTTGGTTTTTDTVTFDSFTETVITGGTTLTTQFYTVGGQRVAMKQGNALYYLLGDLLSSVSIVLKDDGTFQAAQLFAPYGTTRYTQGTMPTTYNFTGQRLDSQTGLLYYNSRYYDPVVGRFARADTAQGNGQGMDPYAYVGGDPETKTDPTGQRACDPTGGHCGSPCGGSCSPGGGGNNGGGGNGGGPAPCHGDNHPWCSSGSGHPNPKMRSEETCNNNNNPCAIHSKNALLSDRSKERTKVNAWWSFSEEVASGIAELIAAVLDLVTQQWVRLAIDVIAAIAHFTAGYADYQTATGQQIPPLLATIENIAHAVAQVADFVSEIADVISIVFPGGAIRSLAEKFLKSLEPVARFQKAKVILQTFASAVDLGSDIQAYSSDVAWNQEQQNINNLAPQDAYNQCIAAHSVAICS